MLIIIYNVYLTLKQNFYYRHSTLRDRLIISNKTKNNVYPARIQGFYGFAVLP